MGIDSIDRNVVMYGGTFEKMSYISIWFWLKQPNCVDCPYIMLTSFKCLIDLKFVMKNIDAFRMLDFTSPRSFNQIIWRTKSKFRHLRAINFRLNTSCWMEIKSKTHFILRWYISIIHLSYKMCLYIYSGGVTKKRYLEKNDKLLFRNFATSSFAFV